MQTILSRMLVVWMAAGLTAAVSGQGTINFDNSPGAIGGTNRIRDIDGTFIGATPGPPGTNFFAQLYAAAGTGVASSALVAIGQPVNFRSGSGAGYVQVTGTTTLGYVLTPGPRSMVTIPASVLPTPGGAVTVQVRAWWAMGPGGTSITNYEAAVSSSDTNSRWGASQTLNLAATGDPTALPPTVPVNLFGFQGFELSSTQQVTDPVITTQPQSQTVNLGEDATFTVLAGGSAPLSYQWNWNGTNIAGATSASLTLSNVQLAQAGSYAVQVTNAFGSTNSTRALLTVNPAPSCATPPSGLVSWWRGENNANDAMAGNNGTLRNGVTFSAGEAGQAFNFNGVNQYVQVSNSSSLNPSGSFSIEGWIYPRQDGVRHIITKWGDAGDQINQRSYDIATLQNRALRFDLADLANQTNIAFIYLDTPTNVLTINGWNHVAAVYDQGLGSRRIYVNGVKAAERIDAPITVLNSTAAVSIGANVYSSTGVRSFFNGLIDELSLYAKALSEAEIQAIYNASVSGKCRRPPTVSILSPTNGTVMLAPASFTLLAEAADDLGVTRVEFWSGTNSLGTLTNAPWYVLQTDLPPSEYHLRAVAVDILSLAATSAVSTVTVLSQPPTEPQALVTNGVLVRQTGLFYQTIHIANPTVATFAALRLWVELDTNSVAHGVRFWNATGQSNGVPYLAYNQPLTPGRSVDLSIEYFVPDRRTLPNPVFRTEVVSPESPVEPEGTFLASVRQVPLTSGLVLVEFSTIAGRIYYVQYSGDMVQWKTAMPAIVGTGTRLQWIDNGPPKTESLPSSEPSRFYRVILLP